MIFFKYRRYLEKQIEELKQEKRDLRDANARLISIVLKEKRPAPPATTKPLDKSKHDIQRDGERAAKCSCGWSANSDDPAKLQNAVSQHHRENFNPPIQGTRKTWPQIKGALEQANTDDQASEEN